MPIVPILSPSAPRAFARRSGHLLPAAALAILCAGYASAGKSAESTVEILHSFAGDADGRFPEEALIEHGGVLYGTTLNGGGTGDCGTVFGLSRTGGKTFTYAQSGLDGCAAKTLAAVSGSLYGVTELFGVPDGYGTAFRVTTGGDFTLLHRFGAAGETTHKRPEAGLIASRNGALFGTTSDGGATGAGGSVFRLGLLAGDEVVVEHLHTFASGQAGRAPVTRLVEDANTTGVFYGTTSGYGGCVSDLCGTLFSITAGGIYQLLHSFVDQQIPAGPLVHAADGRLYGVSTGGGAFGQGMVYRISTAGTGFDIVHSFNAASDGMSKPTGGLALGSDGQLYGTAEGVFRLTTGGQFTALITTTELTALLGARGTTSLKGGLLPSTDGALYGISSFGGTGPCTHEGSVIGCGTAFRVVPGDETPAVPVNPDPPTPINPGPPADGDGGGGAMDASLLGALLVMLWMGMRRRTWDAAAARRRASILDRLQGD